MKQIEDIRRENMAKLAKRFGGNAGLANTLSRSEAQVSQWINGSLLPSGKKRGMRSETARWIETTTGIHAGWLDTNHEKSADLVAESAATYRLPPRHARPLVQELIELAEQIDDAGLNRLLGVASTLASSHPLIKTNVRSSA